MREYVSFVRRVFSGNVWPESLHLAIPTVELDRAIAIYDGPQIVASAHAWSYPLTLPGAGPVPAAAVSRVAVRTTHRRRGLLSRMMRHQLEDVHRRGEVVAALFASEAPIYGRFGYGLATYEVEAEVARAKGAFRVPVDLSAVREIELSRAPEIAVGLAAAVAPRYPGFVQRDRVWWDMVAADPADLRFGAGQLTAVIREGEDGPDGLALYRLRIENGHGARSLQLEGILARTDAAYTALWRHCLDVDLTERLTARGLHPGEPLRHLLVDPRAYAARVEDGLWVRLVDVAGALGGRRYRAHGTLSLRVEDAFCDWNTGDYVLEAGPDGASCRMRPTSTPDLVLPVDVLGAVFLGSNHPSTLAAAGRLEERTPGALALADEIFGWPDPAWCPLHF